MVSLAMAAPLVVFSVTCEMLLSSYEGLKLGERTFLLERSILREHVNGKGVIPFR